MRRASAMLRVAAAGSALVVLLAGQVGLLMALVEAMDAAPTAATQAAVAGLLGLPSVVLGALLAGEMEEAVRELMEDDR